MAGLFDGTPLERPMTCERCHRPLTECGCPRDTSGQVLLPGQQTATLRLDKRAGGKIVTLVEGLDPNASDLNGLLKEFQNRCAAGGTIRDGAIEVQGDHRQTVEQLLRSNGYRVKLR